MKKLCYNHSMYTCVQNGTEALLALGAVPNRPLSELTSFKIGGNAAWVLGPDAYETVGRAIGICQKIGLPYYVLGRGTNILASDKGYSGLIIRMEQPIHEPIWNGAHVTVCAGTSLTKLAKESVERGFMGMERLCGIPGSVGGACAMNAGAYGAEIKQILSRVRVLQNGIDAWQTVDPDTLGYRKSPFAFPDCIVLEAEFSLMPDDGTAAETMRECTRKRREKQPLSYPSAGSVFKRPTGNFAGALIEQCGLKGVSVGGAQVSELHAGFIINTGHATEHDVTTLIEKIQEVVLAQTGTALECEIKRLEG